MEPIQKKKKKPYNQKTAKLTPEEQAMREENLEARKNMNDSAVRNLFSAVCLNSCHEYRAVMRKIRALSMRDLMYTAPIAMKKRGRPRSISKKDSEELEKLLETKKELEEFFDGDIFASLTGVSGKEEAIRKILSIPDGYDHLLGRRLG